jgi:hypothetical protein
VETKRDVSDEEYDVLENLVTIWANSWGDPDTLFKDERPPNPVSLQIEENGLDVRVSCGDAVWVGDLDMLLSCVAQVVFEKANNEWAQN